MTIFEAYNSTKKKLEAAGVKDFVFEAKQIIKHITGFSATQILTNYNNKLTEFQENNLVAIVDYNNLQIDGEVSKVMSVYPIVDKFESFGWNTFYEALEVSE